MARSPHGSFEDRERFLKVTSREGPFFLGRLVSHPVMLRTEVSTDVFLFCWGEPERAPLLRGKLVKMVG